MQRLQTFQLYFLQDCEREYVYSRISASSEWATGQDNQYVAVICPSTTYHERRKQFHFRVGGGKHNRHCDAAICAACTSINEVSRVKYWGADPGPPGPPGSYAYAYHGEIRQPDPTALTVLFRASHNSLQFFQ